MKVLGFCMSQRDLDFFYCLIVLTTTHVQVWNTLLTQRKDFHEFSTFCTALPEHHILDGLVISSSWTFLL